MGFPSKVLRLFLSLGASLVFSGCATLDEDPSGMHTFDLEGRVAVLVVDNSGGPEEFDPDGMIRQGAKFLLSTFSHADNVGIVTVRFPVEAVFNISHLAEKGVREEAMEALDALKIGGGAEYFDALKKAGNLLDVFSAQRDSAIVFLTGGRKRPGGNAQEIRELMRVFAGRGWRFFPVVLTPAPDLMGMLEYGAALTQGAVFKIERPADILPSLVAVSGKINDLWIRRDLSAAPVFDGAKRLLVALTRDEEEADLEAVTRDEKPVPFSGTGGASMVASSAFSVLTIPDPAPGTWAGAVKGTATSQAMFVKPPFDVYLDTDVKGSILEGDEISFHVVVEGEKEALQAWAPKGYSDVVLVSETTGKVVKRFPMDRTFIVPKDQTPTLRFSGKTRLFTSEPGTPEIFTARITLVFGEGENAWAREEFLSFRLKPTAALDFRVEPSEVDMGTRWVDEREISRNVEIVARVEEPVDVRATELSEGLEVEPVSITASRNARGSMQVALGEAIRLEGGGEGTLSFKVEGTSRTEEGTSFDRVVKVTFKLVKFVGPSMIELESMTPGAEKRISLSTWSVDDGNISFSAECGPLEGPGLIVPAIHEEEGARVLRISIPENAALGHYEGRIVITPDEKGLSNRFIPLAVEVVSRGVAGFEAGGAPELVADPKRIELAGAATGWVRSSFQVSVPEGKPPVTIAAVRPSSLRGKNTFETISAQFDIRFSPAPGWGGKELKSGKQSAYILEVYVSSDLPDDVYEGEAVIQYRVAGEDKIREVPVGIRVTLTRSE